MPTHHHGPSNQHVAFPVPFSRIYPSLRPPSPPLVPFSADCHALETGWECAAGGAADCCSESRNYCISMPVPSSTRSCGPANSGGRRHGAGVTLRPSLGASLPPSRFRTQYGSAQSGVSTGDSPVEQRLLREIFEVSSRTCITPVTCSNRTAPLRCLHATPPEWPHASGNRQGRRLCRSGARALCCRARRCTSRS